MAQVNVLIGQVVNRYAELPGVVAVAIGGSRAGTHADERSDIDLCVYADTLPPLTLREAIADAFSDRSEVGNEVFESGDEWFDRETGVQIDVIYRSPSWIEGQVARVMVRHEASVGYSTAILHNVREAVILHDPTAWYARLQETGRGPYPEELRRAIIAKNHPILRRTISSYLVQIERAIARNDALSVQHRVTALLASYFDILFALNRTAHPGEKRQLTYAARLPLHPARMEEDIAAVLAIPASPPNPMLGDRLHRLIDGLDALLIEEGSIEPE